MQAHYHTTIVVAVELNRLSDSLSVLGGLCACAFIVVSLYLSGLILEPYKVANYSSSL